MCNHFITGNIRETRCCYTKTSNKSFGCQDTRYCTLQNDIVIREHFLVHNQILKNDSRRNVDAIFNSNILCYNNESE